MIQVAQMAQSQHPPLYNADTLKKDAKAAEEFISNQSEQMALQIIRYIYGEDRELEPIRDRRRKWYGWEI